MAEMAGVHLQCICQAAMCASSSTFAKYYRLNLIAKARSDFDRRVLRLAGFKCRVAGTGSMSGYHIPMKKSRHPLLQFCWWVDMFSNYEATEYYWHEFSSLWYLLSLAKLLIAQFSRSIW